MRVRCTARKVPDSSTAELQLTGVATGAMPRLCAQNAQNVAAHPDASFVRRQRPVGIPVGGEDCIRVKFAGPVQRQRLVSGPDRFGIDAVEWMPLRSPGKWLPVIISDGIPRSKP